MNSINEIANRLLRRRLTEAKEKIIYSELDHDDLITMAKQEDNKAFEELLRQYDPIISKQMRKYFLETGHGDSDDIRQMATIAFWNAVESYNPSIHKHGFGAYAKMIIDRKLTDELRKDSAEKRQIYNVTNSTEDVLGDDGEGGKFTLGDTLADDDQLSPEEYYLGVDGAKELMDFMMNNFSEKERNVVMRRINGDSISDIMEETGMKYKAVENTLKRIKDKLAEYLRNRESKKIRESAGVEFSDEEKKILTSILYKVDEQKKIQENKKS